jgi:hypothetical protein
LLKAGDAADTRGYTYGTIVDYEDGKWGIRFAEALMPKVVTFWAERMLEAGRLGF